MIAASPSVALPRIKQTTKRSSQDLGHMLTQWGQSRHRPHIMLSGKDHKKGLFNRPIQKDGIPTIL